MSAPSKTDRARQRVHEPGDRPQRRRLAGAVGPEQRHHLAGATCRSRSRTTGRRRSRRSGPSMLEHRVAHRGSSMSQRVGSPARAGAAEVGRDHRGSRRTSLGRAVAITLPNSSTTMWSQTLEHEAHVVVDEQHRRAAVDDRAQLAAELARSRRCRGRRRARRGTATRGSAASARATPTSLRWPWVSSVGQSPRRRPRGRRSVERLVAPRRALGGGLPQHLADRRPAATGAAAATARFSPTVRSSNSSIACHVRASPRRARSCGGSRGCRGRRARPGRCAGRSR